VIIVSFGIWGRYYESKQKASSNKGEMQEEVAELTETETVKR